MAMRIEDVVTRVDSAEKLSGQAQYIEDVVFEGMQFARTLRSTVAHGEILSIDYPECPTGITVVDARDIGQRDIHEGMAVTHNEVAMILKDMPIFAESKVTYVGEPIALVVGADKDQVVDYLSRIEVHYRELPGIFSMAQALEAPEPMWFTEHRFTRGDIEALAEDNQWDLCYEGVYETGYQEQLYMEKQGMVAKLDGDVLTVYGSLQCPYYVLNALKHATGLDSDRLRVVQSPTGGAFGGKEEYPSLLACQVAVAAKKVRGAVQLVFDRREDMAYTTKRHPSRVQLQSYVRDGRVVGMRCHIDIDAGSYLGLSDVVLQRAMLTMSGCYQVPNLVVSGRTIKTNNVFTGAFRGFGAPQSMFALELHMDQLAKRLGISPIDFKSRHYVHQGEVTSTGGVFHEPIALEALTDRLMALSQYEERRGNATLPDDAESALDREALVGYGFAVVPHGGGFTGDGEAVHIKAEVRLQWDRELALATILVSNVEMGQGAITSLSKIVAATLGIEMDRVYYHNPDTDYTPDSGPTVASRTTMVVGGLLHRAAKSLKAYLEQGTLPGEFSEAGAVVVVTERFRQPNYVKWRQETMTGNAYMAYSWAAVLARVRVNPVTLEVACTDIWGVYDIGQPIDELLALGQVHGGVVQGLGYALLEQMTSTGGRIDQVSFSSYPIPTTLDVPRIHTDWLENPYEDGPFGAKALGELTLVAVAPAIAAAVADATGVEVNCLPITPEKLGGVLFDGSKR